MSRFAIRGVNVLGARPYHGGMQDRPPANDNAAPRLATVIEFPLSYAAREYARARFRYAHVRSLHALDLVSVGLALALLRSEECQDWHEAEKVLEEIVGP